MEITPPEEVILGLTQAQRARLYPQLMPKNTISPFFQPFTLPNGGIDAVSHRPTGLPPDQIDRIRTLSFTLGSTTRLSDINLLMGKAMNDDERLRILKTLSRASSLSTRLKLHPGTNLQKLTSYWESGGKNKDIGPILESVIRTSGIDHIDLVHLLPPTPRKLLHTYPSPSGEGLGDDLPDCFWTSFAFFADTPPDRHLDFVGHIFNERYERAEKPLQFGDLVLFTKDGPTDWIHACNYIAGNLVFTKNGMSMGRPWSILPLNEVPTGFTQDIIIKGGPITLLEERVEALASVHQCKPGPWGDLEYYYTYLEAPPHLMALINTPSSRTIWDLPGKNPIQLREFLIQAGMLIRNVDKVLQVSVPFQGGPDYRSGSRCHLCRVAKVCRKPGLSLPCNH